jgi:hypothetical protein
MYFMPQINLLTQYNCLHSLTINYSLLTIDRVNEYKA